METADYSTDFGAMFDNIANEELGPAQEDKPLALYNSLHVAALCARLEAKGGKITENPAQILGYTRSQLREVFIGTCQSALRNRP